MNLFFLSLPFLTRFFNLKWDCPPPEDIYPCSCTRSFPARGVITCNNLNSPKELARMLQNTKGYNLTGFILQNSSMQHIPKDAFQDVHFTRMDILNVNFTHLFEGIPQYPGIVMMVFKEVHVVRNWDWKPFSAFTDLDTIRMYGVKLDGLSDFRRYAPRVLEEVLFDRCEVKELRKDEFQEFSKLRKVTITNDRIKELKRSMFPRPTEIIQMVFHSNQISTIPEDLFEGMQLSYVVFSNNQIMVLPENICRSIPVPFLYFADNPFKCDCAMKLILSCHRRVLGTCASPENMKGRQLNHLKEDDFKHC